MTSAKKTIQDVTSFKRSIQDIPIPNEKKPKTNHKYSRSSSTKKTFFGKGFLFSLLAIIVVVFVFLSFVSSSVIITINPKQLEKRTDANFIAVSDDETGGVPFDIINLEEISSSSVPVESEEDIEERASGTIIVFNNFSSDNQRLIKNTRFETPEGLIYRIQQSIVVSGQEKDSTGKDIPGSIEVIVYADQPGDKFNIGLSDFTIPGFSGTERFDKFYARSKSTMTGGFSGTKKIASEENVENARLALSQSLTKKLIEDIKVKISEDFVLFEDAIFVESEFVGTFDLKDGVEVKEKVNVYAIIFDKNNLSKYVAENTVDEYDGSNVIVVNWDELEFEIKNKADVIPWIENRFVFSLKGKTNFEWVFDIEKLKNDFVGQPKSNTNVILSNYDSIEQAEVVIKPFWKSSFPRSTGKIEVIISS
ncbi:MAG: hypothetical protein KAR54_02505 [Candidatus Pacebacteria bacterium]|nr:hypothetical protein [Candidatus Paceibacterota bacterium]